MKVSFVNFAGPSTRATRDASCTYHACLNGYDALRNMRGLLPKWIEREAVAREVVRLDPTRSPAYGCSPVLVCEAMQRMGLLADWQQMPRFVGRTYQFLDGILYALANAWPCTVSLMLPEGVHDVCALGFDDASETLATQDNRGNGFWTIPFSYFTGKNWGAGVALKTLPDEAGYVQRDFAELRSEVLAGIGAMRAGSVTTEQVAAVCTAVNQIGMGHMTDQKTIDAVRSNIAYLLNVDIVPTLPPEPTPPPVIPPPVPTTPPPTTPSSGDSPVGSVCEWNPTTRTCAPLASLTFRGETWTMVYGGNPAADPVVVRNGVPTGWFSRLAIVPGPSLDGWSKDGVTHRRWTGTTWGPAA